MASQVDIVNHALTRLGEARIQDMGEDSKAAEEASAVWDLLLDAELSANNWKFATKRASLPASATPPAFGFARAFPVPADFLALSYVVGQNAQDTSDYRPDALATFEIEAGQILTDLLAPLRIVYVARVTDPNLWDSGFRNAFAIKMAQALCYTLTPLREGREQLLFREYQMAVETAKQRSAIQAPPQFAQDSTWFAERES